MPILLFEEDVKSAISALRGVDAPVLGEFCSIAVRFVQFGANARLYGGAAQALKLSVEAVEAAVAALAYVLTECVRNRLSDLDFQESWMVLQFPPEAVALLKDVYAQNGPALRAALAEHEWKLPHYVDSNWRLYVELSSRALHRSLRPAFTLQLRVASANGA